MYKPSDASQTKVQASSSGQQIMRFHSLTNENKRKNIQVEINFDDFVKKIEGNLIQDLSLEKQYPILTQMFGFLFNNSKAFFMNEKDDLQKGLENLKESSQENSENQIEKPNNKKNEDKIFYVAQPSLSKCLVCKQLYENYFQHISTITHKKKFNLSNQNLKISMDDMINDLIKSTYGKDEKNKQTIQQVELVKRPRLFSQKEVAIVSKPQKKKVTSQIPSTILNSNSLGKKQSFFN